MADLVDTIRAEIDGRMAELRPLIAAAASLQAALTALDAVAAGTPSISSGRRAPGAGGVHRGRASREQLVDYLRAHPGSTAGDVADALGVKRTSVATRLVQLVKAGELTKAPRGYSAR